jgi:putative nucleotidyltransferase with HDIG domain
MGKTINVRNLETPNLPILGDTQLLVTEPKILVVDDEKQILDLLADFLGRAGYQVTIANNAQTALHALTQETFSLVLSDLKMPEMNSLEMLVKIKEIDPNIVTIIMTGYGTLESAVAAMKHGAFDYVLKPFKVDQVISLIQRGLENRRLKEENLRLKEIVSLYNMSEAISQSLHAELIHEITLDTIYSAIETDFVNLLLRDQSTTPLYEVGNRTAISVSGDFLFQESFIGKLLSMHAEKIPVVFDMEKCQHFFGTEICQQYKVHSFLSVPITINNIIKGMANVFSMTGKHRFTEGQRKTVAMIATRAAAALENARLYGDLEESLHQTIEGLAKTIEAKDPYTHGHSQRVREYAMLIASLLNLSSEEVETVGKAALLHDIGKIGVDLTYINSPGSLTGEQVQHFRTHPEIGKEILSPINSLSSLIPMVYHHHEHFDGSGYPSKLAGEQIPLGARILAIADSYDAMTSNRAYRKAMSYENAIAELRKNTTRQFDVRIVEAFIAELDRRIANNLSPFLEATSRRRNK